MWVKTLSKLSDIMVYRVYLHIFDHLWDENHTSDHFEGLFMFVAYTIDYTKHKALMCLEVWKMYFTHT